MSQYTGSGKGITGVFVFILALLTFSCSEQPTAQPAALSTALSSVQHSTQKSSDNLLRLIVANAGLALAGSKATLQSNFPYTTTIETELAKYVINNSRGLSPLHYDLVTDELINTRLGDTVSVALVLDKESVAERQIGDVHQVIVDIVASAVVFDFREDEKAIIAAFPVPSLPCIETWTDKAPSRAEIQKLLHQYYFGGACGETRGLLANYIDLLHNANIQQKYDGEIGIGEVTISGSALAQMPSRFQRDTGLARHYLATGLSRSISQQRNISIIPYQADNTLTTLSLRFTGETDTVLLSLPQPDYVFDIHLQALKNKLVEKIAAGSSYIYASRINLQFKDGFFQDGSPIFHHSLKYGVAVRLAASQKSFDEWQGYDGAISGLLREFARNLEKPQKNWLKAQSIDRAKKKQVAAMNTALTDLTF